MKRLLLLGLAALIVVLAGCSSAGPFVTNVSSDGRGTVLVEKAMLQYNSVLGTVSVKDRSTSIIRVAP